MTAEAETREKPSTDPSAFSKRDSLYLKGWAILLMLIHHLFSEDCLFIGLKPLAPALCGTAGRYGQLCVGLFLFASGIGMFHSGITLTKNLRRAGSLYLKLWGCMLLVCIPVMLLTGNFTFDAWEFFKNLIAIGTSYNTAWWFVFLYAKLMVVSWMISRLIRTGGPQRHLFILLLFAAVSVVLYALTGLTAGLVNFCAAQLYETFVYAVTFLIGFFAAEYRLCGRLLDRARKLPVWASLCAAAGCFAVSIGIYLLLRSFVDMLFIEWLAVPPFVCGVIFVRGTHGDTVTAKGMIWFGRTSVWFWLLHMTVIDCLPGVLFLTRYPVPTLLWLIVLLIPVVLLMDLLYSLPKRLRSKRARTDTAASS